MTLAEIISELDGPAGERPWGAPGASSASRGDAKSLREVWIALGANMRDVLDAVTIADLVAGELPEKVRTIADAANRHASS